MDQATSRRRFLQFLAGSPLFAGSLPAFAAEGPAAGVKLSDPIMWAPLTTLSQSTAEMGYWAVARLAERLRPRAGVGAEDRAGPEDRAGADRDAGSAPTVMLPVRLEVRGSTGPPRLFDA